MNSRNRVPMVEGAHTPSAFGRLLDQTEGVRELAQLLFDRPPLRTISRSSMLSALADMSAITVASLGAGLAEPEAILGSTM